MKRLALNHPQLIRRRLLDLAEKVPGAWIGIEMTTNCWFEDLEIIWESVRINFRRWSPKKIKQLCNLT